LVEGTVRVEGDRTRISVRLIRTSDQSNLWTSNYDRKISGILAVQTEVAREVASRLSLTLTGPTEQGSPPRTVNSEAYMSYLRGRYHYHKFTTEGFITATRYFQKAVQLDPAYAPSWVGLADAYRLRGSWWGDLPPREAFPIARDAASRALALAPTLGEAHAALAWIRFVFDWDWAGADVEFKRAITLSPNSRDTHSPYANYLRCLGRLKEAEVQIQRSLEIDPLSPLELSEAGLVYIAAGDLQKAERFIRQAADVDPNFPGTLFAQAILYGARGEVDREIAELEKAVALLKPIKMFQAHLANLYIRTGKPERARPIIEQLLKTPAVSAGYMVGLSHWMGDDQKALDWLELAYEERDPLMVWLRLADSSYPLWKYPRFQKIFRLMNFPGPPAGS
jgi:tetratricopeptide (TPR) repeat protein